jgi:hypothetical protein
MDHQVSRERTGSLEPGGQGLVADESHDQERGVALGPEVVDWNDAGVLQAGRELGLPVESCPRAFAGEQVGPDGLDGDNAMERGVASQIHRTHPAGPDQANWLESPAWQAG